DRVLHQVAASHLEQSGIDADVGKILFDARAPEQTQIARPWSVVAIERLEQLDGTETCLQRRRGGARPEEPAHPGGERIGLLHDVLELTGRRMSVPEFEIGELSGRADACERGLQAVRQSRCDLSKCRESL